MGRMVGRVIERLHESWCGLSVAQRITISIPILLLVGTGYRFGQDRLEPDRGEPQSLAEQTADAASTAAATLGQTLGEIYSQYQARDRGEALCILAGLGNLDAVKQLLAQGEDVNARDRAGATPLLTAAKSGNTAVFDYLVEQSGVDLQATDGEGLNAYVYARSRANNGEMVARVRQQGLDWPESTPAGREPEPLVEDSLLNADAILKELGDTRRPEEGAQLASWVKAYDPLLFEAVINVDCGPQLNEPELQQAAIRDRNRGLVLLLNRMMGVEGHTESLYVVEYWRYRKLPERIMSTVRQIRKLRDEGYGDGPIRDAIRKQNAMILAFVLGTSIDIRFTSGERPVMPERMPIPENAPSWVARPLAFSEIQHLTKEQIQEMINELLAAGGQDFGSETMNQKYRDKGYVQWSEEPVLTPVQQENLKLLTDRRSELRNPPDPGMVMAE